MEENIKGSSNKKKKLRKENKMKVLYISSLILKKSSSAAIRNAGLISGIIDNDIDVDILTIKYPKAIEDEYFFYKIRKAKIYYSELKILNNYLGKNILKKREKVKYTVKLKRFLKDFIKTIYFFPDVDKEWISEFKKIDIDYKEYELIISSSDTKTSHYIGEKIKKKNPNITWFQIWGDPWVEDIGLDNLQKIRAKKKEKELLKLADKIFYVSPITAVQIKKAYKEIEPKVFYIPRGFLDEVVTKTNDGKEELIITYTGILNKNRDITIFLEKIKEYNQKETNGKKIRFDFYGSIENDYLEKLQVYNFFYYNGNISFRQIKKVYEETDYLLFVDNGENTTQIPGKIYDYLGTNKKIICLFKKINDISNYFVNDLKLPVFTSDKVSICDIINLKEREVDYSFSNKEIAKKLLKDYIKE